ncbi:glutamine amidotransferase [Halorussus salinisoli]|uniref:glutamine amidotransferase n=1 Tax=Halorussus salinisoli TaxID=2558242 RepID=UPI0010C218A6|nr:glutamine amidotransferase [Halorussus salinisoli]
MVEVLLAGESWYTLTFEVKGRNVLWDSEYGEPADHLIAALETAGCTVTHQPCRVANQNFPRHLEDIEDYDLVLLSDIGADTLQITPQVADGRTDVDRCELLETYVRNGGALGMIGGYMSFAGKGGQARYGTTPVADVLPVEIAQTDDRVETPSGAVPRKQEAPVDLSEEWPPVLGYNRVKAESDAEVWATIRDDPFLVVGDYGDGSAFALTTDCAPHWAPAEFLEWESLPDLWSALIGRTTAE